MSIKKLSLVAAGMTLAALALPGGALAAPSYNVTLDGSMEGAIVISNGDHVAAGYQFSLSGNSSETHVVVANGTVTFPGATCSNGSSDTGLTIPLSSGPYDIAAGDGGTHPGTNEQEPASFQGSVVASVCGGSGTLNASKGAEFNATLQADHPVTVQIQFHYRDPNAKGKGNYDCSASSSAGLGADVCGASWSGTAHVTPAPIPGSPSITTQASGSGPLGSSLITDTATLSGGSNPTGAITFNLYGPNDTTCGRSSIFTTTVQATGDGRYSFPAGVGFSPSSPGTYYWVVSYAGDANNNSALSGCGAPGESATVTQATPAISTTAAGGGNLGNTVTDTAHLTGGSTPTGTITFRLYGPNDSSCSGTPVTIETVAANGDGDYTTPTPYAPSQAGTYQWIAGYGGDANNAAVSGHCGDPNESVLFSATPVPGIALVKEQQIAGSNAAYTTSTLTGAVGQTVDYKMIVTNTGQVPLTLTLTDPHCDAGTLSGPSGGNLSANSTLPPQGVTYYTCTHVLLAGDAPSFTNTATVTGQPPSGPPVGPVSSSVVVNIPAQGVAGVSASSPAPAACVAKAATVKVTRNTRTSYVATVTGAGVRKVVFTLDGRTIKTLTKPNAKGGKYQVTVNPAKTSYGAHSLVAHVTNNCGKAKATTLRLSHVPPRHPVVPKFTG